MEQVATGLIRSFRPFSYLSLPKDFWDNLNASLFSSNYSQPRRIIFLTTKEGVRLFVFFLSKEKDDRSQNECGMKRHVGRESED